MSDHQQFPPVFGYALLSVLLGRSIGSLQADRCRKPNSLPPAYIPPGTKQPRWKLTEVLQWLDQYREQPAATKEKRKAGRPRKKPSAAPQQGGEQ